MNTHQDACSFSKLIEGSTDKKADKVVQISESRIIRSNLVRETPRLRVATERKIHPMPAKATPIDPTATEWGAKAA